MRIDMNGNMVVGRAIERGSFESAQQDLFKLIEEMVSIEDLKKLLYYNSKDCLSRDNITDEQTMSLLHNQILVVPKIQIDGEKKSTIIVTFDNYTTNSNNPEFRDNIIVFDVLCPMDLWVLDGYNLRPYRIMGEIDKMLKKKKLSGIGRVDFVSANQSLLSDELAGFTLMYRVVNDA